MVRTMVTGSVPHLNRIVPPSLTAATATACCSAASVQLAGVPSPTMSGPAAVADCGNVNRAITTTSGARRLSGLMPPPCFEGSSRRACFGEVR